jgi:hypothetical protein
MFVALVDSDDAPDGEVVLIQAAAPGSTQGMRTATPSMVSAVGPHRCMGCRQSICLACLAPPLCAALPGTCYQTIDNNPGT